MPADKGKGGKGKQASSVAEAGKTVKVAEKGKTAAREDAGSDRRLAT